MLCNALSGWGSISTETARFVGRCPIEGYQCPFGLELHFYCKENRQGKRKRRTLVSMPFRAGTPFLRLKNEYPYDEDMERYQCPLGLGLHFYKYHYLVSLIMTIRLYQCPLGLGLHFYGPPSKT